jgi:CO dehydrogenase/acetyl-CoA synthase beta subunit
MDSIKNMKKVTVAADSEEGLKEGLKKAEDVIEKKMGEEEEEEGEEEEEEGSEEAPACPMMSKEDKIAKLEAELAALKSE